jgi:DNA-binding helix-turn-helix protein
MKININKKAVGSRIKQIRTNKGYTLESFGKLFGASKSNVQKWETGFTLPNKERLASISKIADMTVNELLYGSISEYLENNFQNLFKQTKIEDVEFDESKLIDKILNSIANHNQIQGNTKITINDLDSINRIYDSVVKTAYDNFVNKIMASGIKTQSEIFNVESFMKTLQFDINEVINILITQLEEKGITREEAKQIIKEALNSLK